MQSQNIIKRYTAGHSISDIAGRTGFSTRKIRDILIRNGIQRRSHSEANYLKANPGGDPFKVLKKLTPEEEHLKAMALGLYLTEGTLNHKHSIRFSNSNPGIVKIFVKFLKVICGVPADKIRASLITYPDVDVQKAIDYWAHFLDLSSEQFSKTTVLMARRTGGLKRHSEIGTATVYVHNSKLLGIIKDWVKEYSYIAQIVER
ncbi:MAG: hypothetical protein PHS37_09840 [Candidatus Omnitrophica bacterium]|nr:hypothetical protein [Candidatus Omnitrophota bacterium]